MGISLCTKQEKPPPQRNISILYPNPPIIHFNKSLLTNYKSEKELLAFFLNTSFFPKFPSYININHELIFAPSLDLGLHLGTNSKCQIDDEIISTITDESSLSEDVIKTTVGNIDNDISQIYKFTNILGGDNISIVRIGYRRFEQEPHKFYAIKSISKKHMTQHNIEDLIKEVDIISSLDHPNIIKVYETYNDQLYFHIVMELCEGQNLYEKIRNGNTNINEREVAFIIMKLLHAISYCQKKGIKHCDIKPENIFFESSNSQTSDIKITNFGLSRKYLSQDKIHMLLRSSFYIAPEVLKGHYNSTSDIWSIGAIAYFLINREPTFIGISNNDIFHKIMKPKIQFNTKQWNNISKEAISFIKQCLIKNPNKRPNVIQALSNEWFKELSTYIHNSFIINNNLIDIIREYTPCCKFKNYVLEYLIKEVKYEEVQQYKNIFYAIDLKRDGVIDEEELEKGFEMKGIKIIKDDIQRIMSKKLGKNLEYTEFIIMCLNIGNVVKKDKVEEMFRCFDINGSGYIEEKDIFKVLMRLGKRNIKEEEIWEMMKEVTKEERISFDDFVGMFSCCFENNNDDMREDLKEKQV